MYTFKLQAVLDHRQLIEDNLKKELADIRQRKRAALEALNELKRKEMDTAASLKKEQAAGLSSQQVVAYHVFLKRLCQRMTGQQAVICEIEEQELNTRDALLEAMKKRQILEKLKDQGLNRYHRMIQKNEMNFIDEVAVNQFARKAIQTNGDGQ